MIDVPPSPASTTTPDTAESIWREASDDAYRLAATAGQLARIQAQNGLRRDVHAGSVERLEEDLRRVLAILLEMRGRKKEDRRVVERLRDQKVVLLRVAAELLVQSVVEDLLHAVPVLDDSVLDRTCGDVIVVTKRVLADEVIQILDAFIETVVPFLSLSRPVDAYVGTVRNGGREDGGRNGISGVSDFCVSA